MLPQGFEDSEKSKYQILELLTLRISKQVSTGRYIKIDLVEKMYKGFQI